MENIITWVRSRYELSRGENGHSFRSMEGLRGFAVFMVFLVHYASQIDPWITKPSTLGALNDTFHIIGNIGVDLFFVLSGYLIYDSLMYRPQSFSRFISRRVQRIYPTFIVVFLTYIALSFVFPAENKIPPSMPEAAYYLAENFFLLPGLLPIDPIITVAWTLSYEMFYYLAIPLVLMALRLRQRTPEWRIYFFAIATISFCAYCAMNGGHIRLIMFVAGILLSEALRYGRIPALNSSIAPIALLVGILTPLIPVPGYAGDVIRAIILFISFFVLCFSLFSQPQEWLYKTFVWTPLRWLGNMSYSYYLIHGLALKAAFLVLGKFLPIDEVGAALFVTLLACMFAISLVPAIGLFLIIERPLSLSPRPKSKAMPIEQYSK